MLIDYELTCYRLRSSNCILALATSHALKEQEMQSKITHRFEVWPFALQAMQP
jgi:hypothetical protein